MNIRVLVTFPVEYVCHFPDPLVSHNLAAEQDGAATVQHCHVAPAVLVEIVPQHSASQLRSKHVITLQYRGMARYNVSLDSHPEPGEGGEAARCDLCEVEHQGGHPVPGEVGVTPLSLD